MKSPALSRAMACYGLAILGVHLAFMPLLVLLLPRRVEAVAIGAPATTLSWLLLAGGVMAAISYMIAGHASDHWFARTGSRKTVAILGVSALAIAYLGFTPARSIPALVAALLFFQFALNLAFAPLGALLADHFPHTVKGQMGAIMNAALPASSLAVALTGWAFPVDTGAAFLVVGAFATACMLPLLITWPVGALPLIAGQVSGEPQPQSKPDFAKRDFAMLWSARLLVQLGAGFVFSYIYLFVNDVLAGQTAMSASETLASLSAPAALIAIVVALTVGRLSDRFERRRLPLAFSALLFGTGLGFLAAADGLILLISAYVLIHAGLSAFLSIDTAMVAQIVSGQPRRGLLLGISNLTNAIPAIAVPAMTLIIYDSGRVQGVLVPMFALGALGSVLAALLALRVQSVR